MNAFRVEVGALRVTADRPLGEREARALGTRFAEALHDALLAEGGAPVTALRIGELSLALPDAGAREAGVSSCARQVARRVLEQAGARDE
jgi:hypothetical protein